MAKRTHALTVEHLSEPGLHRDSDVKGLYVKVTEDKTKSWVFRFMLNGRARAMGLGPYPEVGLAEARDRAIDARRLLRDGKDPIEARSDERRQQQLEQAKRVPFKPFAVKFIEDKKSEWKNEVHRHQWDQSLEDYVYPLIGDTVIPDINVDHVLRVLRQQTDGGMLWHAKTPTANRIRERLEMILDAAKVAGLRAGENPAAWDGNLEHILPSPSKIHVTQHHRALHYTDIPAFMQELGKREGDVARALEFLIFTGTRVGETLGARWDEIDLENKVWVLPYHRVKKRKPEDGPWRVPLSDVAIDVIKTQMAQRQPADDLVFPALKNGRVQLSKQSFEKLLSRMKVPATAHGFRSGFRTWSEECTNVQTNVIKAAQAHRQGKFEQAYQRGDLLTKRRELMQAWGRFAKHGATPALRLAG